MRPSKKFSGPAIPEPNVQKVKDKSKWLMEQMETQVWLLASPGETLQLASGQVPPDIMQQAVAAIDAINGRHLHSRPEPSNGGKP